MRVLVDHLKAVNQSHKPPHPKQAALNQASMAFLATKPSPNFWRFFCHKMTTFETRLRAPRLLLTACSKMATSSMGFRFRLTKAKCQTPVSPLNLCLVRCSSILPRFALGFPHHRGRSNDHSLDIDSRSPPSAYDLAAFVDCGYRDSIAAFQIYKRLPDKF